MTGIPGQGSTYTRKIADIVCERLEDGKSLVTICRDIGIVRTTVILWKNMDVDGFADRCARAREEGWEVLAEEILDIADEKVAPDMTQQQRNRIETRKWILSKRLRKTFGDQLDVTQTNSYAGMTDEQLIAERAELSRRKGLADRPGTVARSPPEVRPKNHRPANG